MEYQRTVDGVGNVFQWVDSEVHVVMDLHTGELQRFGPCMSATGTQEQALAYVKNRIGWDTRFAIIKLACIRAFPIKDSPGQL